MSFVFQYFAVFFFFLMYLINFVLCLFFSSCLKRPQHDLRLEGKCKVYLQTDCWLHEVAFVTSVCVYTCINFDDVLLFVGELWRCPCKP